MPATPPPARAAALALDRAALAWRAAELLLVFVALPLLLRARALPGPRLLWLAAVTCGAVATLSQERGFRAADLWSGRLRGERAEVFHSLREINLRFFSSGRWASAMRP